MSNIDQKIIALINATIAKNESQVTQIMADFRSEAVDQKFVYERLFSLLHHDLILALNNKSEAKWQSKASHFLLKTLQTLPLQESGVVLLLALELKLLEIIFLAQKK